MYGALNAGLTRIRSYPCDPAFSCAGRALSSSRVTTVSKSSPGDCLRLVSRFHAATLMRMFTVSFVRTIIPLLMAGDYTRRNLSVNTHPPAILLPFWG